MRSKHKKHIIVTGAAGFIGSGILRHLNDKGHHHLIVVDDLGKSEKWRNLVGKSFVDAISKHAIFDWLKGRESAIEAIIHLGACSSTVETDASYLLENNTRFSMRLADVAISHHIRFIYASSAATYGDGNLGFSDSHDGLEPLQPLNMYGYSKHLFDLWLRRQGLLDKVVGLKYFNVFGPNEFHKGRMASTIFHFVPQIHKEGKIKLFKSTEPDKFEDGGQKRDFIYVKDAVRMTCAFLENDHTGIFNVGSGIAGTWNQLSNAVFKALQKPVNIEYIPMPQDLVGKYQNYTCADMAKTKKALGKATECMPLEDAVIDYVRNYLVTDKRW
jgi:ADP-L-glycero-D-manno-heptose 6-epimerase